MLNMVITWISLIKQTAELRNQQSVIEGIKRDLLLSANMDQQEKRNMSVSRVRERLRKRTHARTWHAWKMVLKQIQ